MLDVPTSRATAPSQDPRVSENQRDVGLVRAVGPFGLAASIITLTIGAGIFAVPGALAACIGVYAPLAFLVCGVAIGAVAICFAEGGSRMPTSGGAYGYVADAFGPLTGYVVGTLLWISDLLAAGGVAAAWQTQRQASCPSTFNCSRALPSSSASSAESPSSISAASNAVRV